MLTHFTIAQPGELLGSILARFIEQHRIGDDKVALQWLFDNRKVVPSAHLQGHIKELHERVGHIWKITPEKIIYQHTLLPLFAPFTPPQRYKEILNNIINGSTNTSSLRTGMNTGSLIWPDTYQVCSICLNEQKQSVGFYYINRLFQCAGVDACPKHHCLLYKTTINLQSEHRHRFVGLPKSITYKSVVQAAPLKLNRLAGLIEELLEFSGKTISCKQWSRFYQHLAQTKGLMNGKWISHEKIKTQIQNYWGKVWLKNHGLQLEVQSTWLLEMFRAHRRSFNYLQHLIVCLALNPEFSSLSDLFKKVSLIPAPSKVKSCNKIAANQVNIEHHKNLWLKLLQDNPYASLKQLRSTKEGVRLYTWLYRNLPEWLAKNKPKSVKNYINHRVDWGQRDKELVKTLLQTEHSVLYQLTGPRRSKNWYAKQIKQFRLNQKKLHKLPLCRLFFDRYSETTEEYQTRRLACVMDHLIESKDYLRPICEIERLAGLSHQRSRKPVREILRLDIPAWQRIQTLS